MLNNEARKELGKFFIAIGKLVFAGVILATALKIDDFPKLNLILFGTLGMISIVTFGVLILNIIK
jgi:hypothetical protein